MAKAAKTVEEKAPKKVTKKVVEPKVKAEKKVVAKKNVAKTPKVKVEKAEVVVPVEVVADIVVEVAPEAAKEAAPEVVKAPRIAGSKVTVEELFEAGAHYGHVVKKWNPKMKGYLWGSMNGIHIFDLEQTVKGLEEACKTLSTLASTGKRIVIVGTKRQAKQMVEDEARRLGVPFITQRWMGGLITNWKQVKLTIDRLNKLKKDKEEGNLKKYTKKEQILFDKEISRLERIVGGISTLKEAPEVVVVIDTHKEKLVVKESHSKGVIVIGLVDSNANPDNVDYVIPMNDDSAKGLEIVIGELGRALETGLKNLKSK
jgi:small subunit ribosomal protein S2